MGDPDQLPSIGPGQVFYDLIHHSPIASFQLTTNHRQVNEQGIVSLAQTILRREPVYTALGDDVSLVSEPSYDRLESLIAQLFLQKIPNDHQVSTHDIQLLIPLHKGRFGIDQINRMISQYVRPKDVQSERWAVGDRVMQCRNNYSKHVMNGDIKDSLIAHNEVVIRLINGMSTTNLRIWMIFDWRMLCQFINFKVRGPNYRFTNYSPVEIFYEYGCSFILQ